jgi:hypothetical protein
MHVAVCVVVVVLVENGSMGDPGLVVKIRGSLYS